MIDKLKKYIVSHCERMAKKYGTSVINVQLRFSIKETDGEQDVCYITCKQYKREEEHTIRQVLNITFIDVLNLCTMVPPHILNSLKAICHNEGIEENQIYVFASPYVDKYGDIDIMLHVYNGGTCVKQISLEELITGGMGMAE